MCTVASIEIVVICIYFIMPTLPFGIPWNDDFSWRYVNYAPILTGAVFILLTIWWFASARNWFTGPRTTIDLPAGGTSSTPSG
jgi:hypothetical protein